MSSLSEKSREKASGSTNQCLHFQKIREMPTESQSNSTKKGIWPFVAVVFPNLDRDFRLANPS